MASCEGHNLPQILKDQFLQDNRSDGVWCVAYLLSLTVTRADIIFLILSETGRSALVQDRATIGTVHHARETIDSFNTSETRGRELSHGLNYQKLGKQLMTEDEIAVMDGGKCILQLRGVRPFFSDKFDITKHPKYKYLSDADPKNAFDMEKHLKRRPAIVKPDEVFDYYEIDAADLQEDADHEET